jgi:hypothetical protein
VCVVPLHAKGCNALVDPFDGDADWLLAYGDFQRIGNAFGLQPHRSETFNEGYANRTMERALAATRKRRAHLLANEAQDTESSTLYSDWGATSEFYEIVIITQLVKPLSETGVPPKTTTFFEPLTPD